MTARAARYLLIAGLAFLAAGGIIIAWLCVRPIAFREADAVVVTSDFSDSNGMIEPIVRFEADGETVQHRAQPMKGDLRPGDTVRIAYERRNHFGLEGWRIYVGKDAASAARITRRAYVILAAAALLAGAAMTVASLWMKKRMG